MPGLLEGRTALITGSGSGMGRSHARLLAERGANVIVHDVDASGANETAGMVREGGGTAAVMVVDVRDVSGFRDALGAAVAEAGAVDILVNNAGVGGQGLAIEDIDEATFDRMFAVHVKGSFFATQAVVPGMKERGYGKIVNVSSTFAMGGSEFASHYAAAKSALSGFTKSWARELARHKICVNAVAPGILETPMTLGSIGKERINSMISDIPLGRIAETIDISYAVAWLAGPETDFMTGQIVSPNGGVSIVGI
jgi:NAD(P)-dependent dehydrogenase (short-subunit alcohol dehydrogenase family)